MKCEQGNEVARQEGNGCKIGTSNSPQVEIGNSRSAADLFHVKQALRSPVSRETRFGGCLEVEFLDFKARIEGDR